MTKTSYLSETFKTVIRSFASSSFNSMLKDVELGNQIQDQTLREHIVSLDKQFSDQRNHSEGTWNQMEALFVAEFYKKFDDVDQFLKLDELERLEEVSQRFYEMLGTETRNSALNAFEATGQNIFRARQRAKIVSSYQQDPSKEKLQLLGASLAVLQVVQDAVVKWMTSDDGEIPSLLDLATSVAPANTPNYQLENIANEIFNAGVVLRAKKVAEEAIYHPIILSKITSTEPFSVEDAMNKIVQGLMGSQPEFIDAVLLEARDLHSMLNEVTEDEFKQRCSSALAADIKFARWVAAYPDSTAIPEEFIGIMNNNELTDARTMFGMARIKAKLYPRSRTRPFSFSEDFEGTVGRTAVSPANPVAEARNLGIS